MVVRDAGVGKADRAWAWGAGEGVVAYSSGTGVGTVGQVSVGRTRGQVLKGRRCVCTSFMSSRRESGCRLAGQV